MTCAGKGACAHSKEGYREDSEDESANQPGLDRIQGMTSQSKRGSPPERLWLERMTFNKHDMCMIQQCDVVLSKLIDIFSRGGYCASQF